MIVNETLLDIRGRSFFINDNLVCELLVLLLNFSDSGWVSLTVDEGVSSFLKLGSEPCLLELSEIADEFAYPIKRLGNLDKFLGLKVLELHEYRLSNIHDGCIGVYLNFGCCGLSVVESDGCLSITDKIVSFSDDEVVLFRVSI